MAHQELEPNQIKNRTRKLFFGAPRAIGNPTGTSTMFTQVPIAIPSDWVAGTDVYIKAMLRNNTNGGVAVKTLDAYRFRDGVVYNNISPTISINRTITDTISHISTLATWSAANIQHGDVFWVTVVRLGDNAADTNTGVEEHDVTWLEYTADC